MFGKGIRLFKLLGFEVKIDLSWIIIAVLITWSLAKSVFPHFYPGYSDTTYWMMGVYGAIGLFASIIFHELSHSIVARKYGLPIRGITLFIFGGVAEMEEEPATPKVEFMMAVAGPVASIFASGIFYLASFAFKMSGLPMPVIAVLNYLSWLNIILAVFNLLPAFPLDGGRILRSALWKLKNDIRWATGIAARIGSGFGLLLIFGGIFFILNGETVAGVWWFLIGMFIRYASRMSHMRLFIRQALEGEPVSRFMVEHPVTVPPDISIRELVENFIYQHHHKMYPVVEDDRLLGCVTAKDVKAIPREEWEQHTVQNIKKESCPENSVSADSDAMDALSLMHKSGNSRLLVIDEGNLSGIVTLKDLMGFINIKLDLEEGSPGRSRGAL